ncbi:MAG TPA: ATP-binding protein [Acidobacteriota bacterium]|nr:ATP-binding protein [Acidobacteriota bacterium]
MRVTVAEHHDLPILDLRPAGELAPNLALPWIVKLRYGVLFGQILLLLSTHFVFDVELPIAWLAIPLALTAASNLLLSYFAKAFGVRRALGSILTLDTICLTALLALSGGPANPFSLLYLVQITLSAVVLSKEWTWALGILSIVGFGLLFPVHVRVSIFEAHHTTEGFSTHLIGMWIAFAAGAFLITIFIGKVSEALRKREQEVLSLQLQAARNERLSSIVTLAAGAAHELGTPLATIAIASRELETRNLQLSKDPDVAEDARLIRTEVQRCSQILHRMSARGGEPMGESRTKVNFADFMDGLRSEFPPSERNQLQIIVAGDMEATIPADATRQVLTALVRNAVESSSDGRPISITAEIADARARFTVADSGSGMPPEILNRLGEPFFTTKAPGKGMGLGIFLARVFTERLGGNLVFESEIGRGTKALLELPLSTV